LGGIEVSLEGKVALVTGGSRGIGRAIALELAERGADVGINYAGNEAAAAQVVKEVENMGRKALAIQADVSNPSAVDEMFKKVLDVFGRIDILVNNAGITRDNLLMRMKEEDWDQVIDINLKGAFLCTKAVLRQMMRQKAGRIINITSISSVAGTAGQANYASSKAGLIALTKTTAREVASRGITVNAVAPGFIQTEMTDVLGEEYKQQLLEQIPLGRIGDPKDVARLVGFLASDDAAYITGQTIHVNGGMYM
jgi:3-oxoacyl-[acyl-carrier protein] reductase